MTARVYIVEDHELVRDTYALFLSKEEDLEVCGAVGSAEEALEELPTVKPDVLLVDISLPGMSGIDLLETLQASDSSLPSVVLTGHHDQRYRRMAFRAGALGFVMKGDPPENLITAIRDALDGRSQFVKLPGEASP